MRTGTAPGIPTGSPGSAIPLGARILAVVDCYDALTSDRPYRRALQPRDAFALIEARSGTMYDPTVVAAFRDICGMTGKGRTQTAPRTTPDIQIEPTAPRIVAAEPPIDEVEMALRLGLGLSSIFVSSRPWKLAADALLQLPGVAAAVIFRIEEPRQELVVECAAGENAAAIASLSMALGERLSGWVGATSQPMVGADAMLDLFDVPGAALQDAVSAPVHNPDESRMVITLYSAHGALSHVHLRLLEQVARLVTAAPPWGSRSESAPDDEPGPARAAASFIARAEPQ